MFSLKSMNRVCRVPRFGGVTTSLDFHPRGTALVVVGLDGSVAVLDVTKRKLTDWSLHGGIVPLPVLCKQKGAVRQVLFDDQVASRVLMVGDKFIARLDTARPSSSSEGLTATETDGIILGSCMCAESTLLTAQVEWSSVLSRFGGVMARKKFQT